MRTERIELPSSGYGSKVSTLTTYVQDDVEAQAGRLRPAVLICPGGGYAFCSDREAEPIALALLARGLQAFVLCCPVVDLDAGWPGDQAHAARICGADAPLRRAQDLVGPDTPPTFLWHTAADGTFPVRNSYRYAEALAAHGVDHERHVFHAGRHGLSLATTQSSKGREYEVAQSLAGLTSRLSGSPSSTGRIGPTALRSSREASGGEAGVAPLEGGCCDGR